MDRRPKTQLKQRRGRLVDGGLALRRAIAFTAVAVAMTLAPARSALASQAHCATHDIIAHACCPGGVAPAASSMPACEAPLQDDPSLTAALTTTRESMALADPIGSIPTRSQQIQPCCCESGSGVPAIPAVQAEAPRIGERQRDRAGVQPPATINSDYKTLLGGRRLAHIRAEAAPPHYANQPLYLTQQIFLI